MRTIQTLCAIILLLLAGALALASLDGCSQEQIPLNPSPGYPCGTGYYFECPDHGCCGRGERCGEKGHACHEGECCFEGDLFGASRDGGRGTRPQLTPDEARKAGPR